MESAKQTQNWKDFRDDIICVSILDLMESAKQTQRDRGETS